MQSGSIGSWNAPPCSSFSAGDHASRASTTSGPKCAVEIAADSPSNQYPSLEEQGTGPPTRSRWSFLIKRTPCGT